MQAIQVLGLTLQKEILLSQWLLDTSWTGLDLNGDVWVGWYCTFVSYKHNLLGV